MTPLEQAKKQVTDACNKLIDEAQDWAERQPSWLVVCEKESAFNPVVSRDGGYALMNGELAVFRTHSKAEQIAQAVGRDVFTLSVMTTKDWARGRIAHLNTILDHMGTV